MEEIRKCKRCGKTKPIGSFPKRYNRPGLREWTCCMCKKRGWITADPERAKAKKHVEGMRRRARSKGMTVDEYDALMAAKHGPKADGRIRIDGVLMKKFPANRTKCPVLRFNPHLDYLVNRDHHLERSRIWSKLNPGKALIKKQRRRFRLAGVTNSLTDYQWQIIQERFDHRCAYCGRRVKLTMDHVTPISKGGSHTVQNVVPACISCNCRKRTGRPLVSVQPMLLC